MADKEILFGWTQNGYNPIAVGLKAQNSNEKSEPEICEYYTLYYVLSGTGTYTINNFDYRTSTGDIIVTAPGDTFSHRAGKPGEMEYIWITFAICGKVPNRFVYSYLHAPQLNQLFADLKEQIQNATVNREYAVQCINGIAVFTEPDCDKDVKLVYDTARYVQTNIHRTDLSIAELAERVSTSRFRLVRAFAKVKNMPPMEFIIRCRLERACEYIRSQRYSLTEISEMTGYKNYSTFARVFKKYYDITPKEYKKQFMTR